MTYGRWVPLVDVAPPGGPGMLQARFGQGAAGLIEYPGGRSAMAYYDADDEDLARALARLGGVTDEEQRKRLWVRFAAADRGRAPSTILDESLRGFRARFGALPAFNRD